MALEIIIALILIGAFAFAFIYVPVFKTITYLFLAAGLGLLFYKFFIKKYDDYERAIIFRFGKFNRIGGPGWTFFIPFIEKEFQRVDVRTKMMDMLLPVAFTSDDLRLKIDGVIYYRISDPSKAILKIDNYMMGLSDMIKSQTRNLLASLSMREVFSQLDGLNELLADKIRHESWKWGIDVPMVQIRGIMPPDEIAIAMQSKEISSQYMQAQRFRAEAKKIVIEAIGTAAKKLDDKAIMYLYLKSLEEMSKGSATKIVFPMQFMNAMKKVGDSFSLGSGLDMSSAINSIKQQISASE